MGPPLWRINRGMHVKIRDLFGKKHTKDGKKRGSRGDSLSEEYLSRISNEERDAFTDYLLKNGKDLYEFLAMDDPAAMVCINRFRASDWYRRNAEVCRLSYSLDPSAKSLYNAREGVWNGHVKISESAHPVLHGYCCNCGKQLIDHDHRFLNGGRMHCLVCFNVLKKFTPVMVHYYHGCIDNGNQFEYHVWTGWDDFLSRFPAETGWHYEWSHSHLMTVKDDRKEWWVTWNIHHPDILREVMERCPEFRTGF